MQADSLAYVQADSGDGYPMAISFAFGRRLAVDIDGDIQVRKHFHSLPRGL